MNQPEEQGSRVPRALDAWIAGRIAIRCRTPWAVAPMTEDAFAFGAWLLSELADARVPRTPTPDDASQWSLVCVPDRCPAATLSAADEVGVIAGVLVQVARAHGTNPLELVELVRRLYFEALAAPRKDPA